MRATSALRHISNNSSVMYAIRLLIAFSGTAFIPYFLNQQNLTIPLTLGVVAAALCDIDDRFSVRLRNLMLTYVGFFISAIAVEILFPHPILFGIGLIIACFSLILLGSLGKRYATISYGCLVISVYSMLGVGIFDAIWEQPLLLVIGAVWYGLLSTISFLLFPVRLVQDQLDQCYRSLGNFLYLKSNFFDVDMTQESHQQAMIELSLANAKLVSIFNETRIALVTRLKGDRGQKDTRNSLQYYFIAQDIHERADSAHIDYQKLALIFKHRDILFRFQRILSLQGKACQDLAHAIFKRQRYVHNPIFKQSFKNLNASIQQLEQEQQYDLISINALRALQRNLKEIDAQFNSLATDLKSSARAASKDDILRDDDLTGMQDIWQRMRQNLSPESGLFRHATRLSVLLVISHIIVQVFHLEHGYWILMTVLFVCQPNFNATRRRLKLRIYGTLAGIILGTFIIQFVPSIEGLLILMILSGVLFLQLRSQQYAQATMFITMLALINFHIADPELNAALPRAIYTFVGCFLAWLGVMFIWPDWKFRRLPRVIQNTFSAQCGYLSEIVKQYRFGKNNGLDYRMVRRRAHIMDAELASLISTLATEPDFDPTQKRFAFRLLCLNHTLLSYIAALGAHRNRIHDDQTIDILNYALKDIQGVLLRDESPEQKAQAAIQTLREHVQQQHNTLDDQSTVILQQVTLILNILSELSLLKQNLSYHHDPDATALASL